MIQREALIKKYNPKLNTVNTAAPMVLGNGNFAFNADITGLQTLYEEYEKACPVLTMSNFGWHISKNEKGGVYSESDILQTQFTHNGRTVKYPIEKKSGNEAVYGWFRENPHKINLARLRFCVDDEVLSLEGISDVNQELDLYSGLLDSRFSYAGTDISVTTAVGQTDTLAVRVDSKLCKGRLTVMLDFPYGNSGITGSDFTAILKHTTTLSRLDSSYLVERTLDDDSYVCVINSNADVNKVGPHEIMISPTENSNLSFTLSLGLEKDRIKPATFKQVVDESRFRFYSYWNMGAMIDVTGSEDERKDELQRRIIQSMYLSYVEDMGFLPPQETGLTCNSWYGKFHLEMHPIHTAFAALYGRGIYLEKSLGWYKDILLSAKKNASRNGYKGARWPKMVGPEGFDSPSLISPILIWQQPHIIYMLELLRQSRYRADRVEVPSESEIEFIRRFEDVIEQTAEFMADFAAYNKEKDCYELLAPLYSVQEKGEPTQINNPAFELAYWSFGLRTAYSLLEKIGKGNTKWLEVADKMAKPYVRNNLLQAFDGFDNTYTLLNMDHPSMLFPYGWLSEQVDEKVLDKSLRSFKSLWDLKSLWGWDFAILAMVCAKHGRMEEAFEMLLLDTEKNHYEVNGFNSQLTRNDLPLYMPGNGSLLLAMTALESCKGWYVQTEGIMRYPF